MIVINVSMFLSLIAQVFVAGEIISILKDDVKRRTWGIFVLVNLKYAFILLLLYGTYCVDSLAERK